MYIKEGKSHKIKQQAHNNVSKSVWGEGRMLIANHLKTHQNPNRCSIIELGELFAPNNFFI